MGSVVDRVTSASMPTPPSAHGASFGARTARSVGRGQSPPNRCRSRHCRTSDRSSRNTASTRPCAWTSMTARGAAEHGDGEGSIARRAGARAHRLVGDDVRAGHRAEPARHPRGGQSSPDARRAREFDRGVDLRSHAAGREMPSSRSASSPRGKRSSACCSGLPKWIATRGTAVRIIRSSMWRTPAISADVRSLSMTASTPCR